MTWALVALLGYFFSAVSVLFDKYLLSDRIATPAIYAFFVALFSLFALFFIPFGFQFLGLYTTGIFLLSGIFFVYGLIAFYTAVQKHEVSRVAPLLGTTVSLVAFLAVFIPGIAGESLSGLRYLLALCFLIGGGLLISFDLPLRKGENIPKLILVAGLAMGVSMLLLKQGYKDADFISGLVWSRLGIFIGGLSLLFFSSYRKQIFAQLSHFSAKPDRAKSTGALFVLNKTCAGVASFLTTYAVAHGSVSFVQALSGMQYVFVLLLAFPLALRYPKIFGEKLSFWDWFQKVVAVILIGLGLWLAATSGVKLLLI